MRLIHLILFIALPLWSYVNQNGDAQLWIGEDVHKKITPLCTLKLSNEWRFGEDMSTLYFFYLQGLCSIDVNPSCEITPGYRQILQLRGSNWDLTSEPLINVTFAKKKRFGQFQFRNRISYLFRENEPDAWLYRARFRWAGTWELSSMQLEPYVSNEFFFFAHQGFSQDRISAGIVIPFFSCFRTDLYYMIRLLETNEKWIYQQILGTWLNLHF